MITPIDQLKPSGLEKKIKDVIQVAPYDRNTFTSAFKLFRDVNEHVENLTKDPYNNKEKEKLSGKLLGDPALAEELSTERLRAYAKSYVDEAIKAFSKYTDENEEEMLGKLKPEDLVNLATGLPGIKGINDTHDTLVDIINEFHSVQEAGRSADGIASYVNKKIQKAPEWFRMVYSGNDAQAFFNSYARNAQYNLHMAFHDTNGKPLDRRAKSVYQENIKKLKYERDDEQHTGDKDDIQDLIDERYVALDQIVYSPERAEQKRSDNAAREDRKARRRKEGIAA